MSTIITHRQFPGYHKYEMELAGRPLTLEVGKLAELANAAVMVGYGDTQPRQLYRFPGALCPGTAAPGQAHRYPAPSAGWKPLPSSPLTPAPLLPCVSLATLPGVCYNNPHVHHPSQGGFP